MSSPCAFHFLSHISDPDAFTKVKKDFTKFFKRALKRQFKGLKQKCPDTLWFYSIEFKMTDVDEINDSEGAYSEDAKKSSIKLPFLHIHFCLIADCNKTIPQSFGKPVMAALNEIDGLTKARYFKTKDRYVSILNEETGIRERQRIEPKIYKSLNKEFDDVYDRAKYLAKVEQKCKENIPFRNKFGSSQLIRKSKVGKQPTS